MFNSIKAVVGSCTSVIVKSANVIEATVDLADNEVKILAKMQEQRIVESDHELDVIKKKFQAQLRAAKRKPRATKPKVA
jgi:outer membrane lipopolysaccharide assembly protein LptE/RlpB